MKYIINKLVWLFCIATTILTSCNEDQKGAIYDGQGKDNVSFLSSAYSTQLVPEMNGVLKVPVCRTDKMIEGTTVNVKVTKANENFTLSSPTVSFTKGDAEAYVELAYDITKLSFGTTYTFTLEIQNENLSPAAQKSCSISVTRKLTWKNIGKGKWTTQLFGGTYDVDFEEAVEVPGKLYRVLDMISDGFPIEINVSKEQGTAWVNFQDTGYDDDGDRLYYNALGTYKNGVITFSKADANHPNYYCIKSATGYSPAYYLVESFEMPKGY